MRHLALILLVAASGCGEAKKSIVPVTGRVTHKGAPAEGATIVFHPPEAGPGSARPAGLVGADGRFELRTGADPGAEPGEYVVTITWERPPANNPTARREEFTDVFRGKYASPKTSGLKATVPPAGGELPAFDLR